MSARVRSAAALAVAFAAAACGGVTTAAPPSNGGGADVPLNRATVPATGPVPELTLPSPQRFRLSNGLQVVLVERHDLPVVDARLVVRTGAEADPPGSVGRMTMLADMLDEGTTTLSALDIADQLDYLGATLRTTAYWDASTVSLHVLRERLEPALDLMADVLLRPSFPQEELERKRDERVARLIQQKDDPEYLADDAFAAVLYGARTPYGYSTLGTEATTRALDRAGLVDAYDTWYRPNNAFLVVVGDVDRAALEPLLQSRFGGWASKPVPNVTLPTPPAAGPTAIYLVDKPGAAQSEIRIGQIGVGRDTPDYFPLLVMNTVLGGSFTSRLNMNLRQEKGYTYGAGSRFDYRRIAGPFVASAAVHTAVTDSAVIEFVKEMRAIRDSTVPQDELARAENYVAYGLARRFETGSDVAARLAEAELYGLGDDYYDHYVANVRAVDAEDVARVARKYLDPAHWAIVVAGDRAEIQADLEALGLGDVVVRKMEGEASR